MWHDVLAEGIACGLHRIERLMRPMAKPSQWDQPIFQFLQTKSLAKHLIDEVRLIPEHGKLRIELRGALAGILALSTPNAKTVHVSTDGAVSVLREQIKLVAGARNQFNLLFSD